MGSKSNCGPLSKLDWQATLRNQYRKISCPPWSALKSYHFVKGYDKWLPNRFFFIPGSQKPQLSVNCHHLFNLIGTAPFCLWILFEKTFNRISFQTTHGVEHNADFCNLDFCMVTSCGHLINVTAPSKTFGVRNREEPFNFQISNVTTKSHRENTKTPDVIKIHLNLWQYYHFNGEKMLKIDKSLAKKLIKSSEKRSRSESWLYIHDKQINKFISTSQKWNHLKNSSAVHQSISFCQKKYFWMMLNQTLNYFLC